VQWIVSVGMVSEGTNIPRLQVCCHLSHVKTELYFRQVLGRILRVSGGLNQEAWLYTIAEHKLTCFAERIAEDLPDGNAVVRLPLDNEQALRIDESKEDEHDQSSSKPVNSNLGTEFDWGFDLDGKIPTNQSAALTLGTFRQRLVSVFCI